MRKIERTATGKDEATDKPTQPTPANSVASSSVFIWGKYHKPPYLKWPSVLSI